ncbi:MAG: RNA pseudouridine synthase [Succinivibrionaceae bacterium]|nr:RNA pseudouridine synthase [Succinivibrionaceae bacterium]
MPSSLRYSPPVCPYLDIIHEDEDLMVVNKPQGLLSVPGRDPRLRDSVLSRVRTMHEGAQAVHRLDLDTSGIMVVGLSRAGISGLGRQFMERRTHKAYLAWLLGEVTGRQEISLPLRTDLDHRPLQIVDFEHGRPATTILEPLRLEGGNTLARLIPVTGRSHQLRVHMAQIGHHILGDPLYGSAEARAAAPTLCLHAGALLFAHPRDGREMFFRVDPPFAAAGAAAYLGREIFPPLSGEGGR